MPRTRISLFSIGASIAHGNMLALKYAQSRPLHNLKAVEAACFSTFFLLFVHDVGPVEYEIFKHQNGILFLNWCRIGASPKLFDVYRLVWRLRFFLGRKGETKMRKTTSIISTGFLAASLLIPIARGYADDNPPGNHQQRQELREDVQRLDKLQRQRDRELRQGDKREAREYNEKIRDQQREIHQDQRQIYGHDNDHNSNWWRRDGRNRDRWQRDAHERWHDRD